MLTGLGIRRLGYALGAEVRGVDLSRPLEPDAAAELRKLWLEHMLLSFPDQDLDPDGLRRFASYFGTLDDNRRSAEYRHPENPDVMQLLSKPLSGAGADGPPVYRAGGYWHTDQSFQERPTTATFLHAKELPQVGGNTMFANLQMAYGALSPGMQRLAESLSGVFDHLAGANLATYSAELQAADRILNPLMVQSIVRTHPETGRKGLFLCGRLRFFEGMTEEESAGVIRFLMTHATRYEFVYRHQWSVGEVIVWDDRCTMHYAVPDYAPGEMRRMLRCALLGEETGRAYIARSA